MYPIGEVPTKLNSETILVRAYTTGTRAGSVSNTEMTAGKSSPGSVAVARIQAGDSTIPQSEIQQIAVTANGGTYTLSFGGQTTASISPTDTAATVQTRLQALSSIGAGNATVSGSAGGPYTVTFAGSLANAAQALITATTTVLTYGGAGSVSVAHTTTGGPGVNDVQTVTVTAGGGSFTLSFGGQTTNALAWNASPDVVSTELQALSSIGSGNVSVASTNAATPGYVVTFIGALGNAAQSVMTFSATLLVLAGQNEQIQLGVDADGGTFRLSADGGVNYTAALAYNAAAATVQTALTGLAAVGANNAVVSYDSTAGVYTVTFVGGKASTSMALTVDQSSLTVATAHITSCTRATDGTTARTIGVGDHVEAAKLDDWGFIVESGGGGNNYDLGQAGGTADTVIYWTQAGFTKSLTGIAGGNPGRRVTLVNAPTVGGSWLKVQNLNAGSSAANQIRLTGSKYDAQDAVLQAGETMELVYDGTESVWVEVARQALASPATYGLVRVANGGVGQQAALAASDDHVVHLAGTETVTGAKTFSTAPLVSDPTNATGYTTGAGGAVTQATSKSTAVTLNRPSGQITMNNAALAAGAVVAFTLNNSTLTATDVLFVTLAGGVATGTAYNVWARVSSGAAEIDVQNISGASLSEAIVLNFVVISGSSS